MGEFLADKLIRNLIVRDHNIRQSKVLILGFSFKENCPDTRNTRVVDVYRHLSSYGICLSVCDPLVEHQAVASEFNIQASAELPDDKYEAIMLCVAHDDFKSQRQEILNRLKPNGFILDLKGFFDRTDQVVRI
jgi:UDP-N-acetyl-D-galactosamine dehydrogenase